MNWLCFRHGVTSIIYRSLESGACLDSGFTAPSFLAGFAGFFTVFMVVFLLDFRFYARDYKISLFYCRTIANRANSLAAPKLLILSRLIERRMEAFRSSSRRL
jgi:hypothetical protein